MNTTYFGKTSKNKGKTQNFGTNFRNEAIDPDVYYTKYDENKDLKLKLQKMESEQKKLSVKNKLLENKNKKILKRKIMKKIKRLNLLVNMAFSLSVNEASGVMLLIKPKKSLYDEYKPYTHGSNQPNINRPPEKKQNIVNENKDNKIVPKLNHEISSQYRNEKYRLYKPNNMHNEVDRQRYLSEDKKSNQRISIYQNYIEEEQNRSNINPQIEAKRR